MSEFTTLTPGTPGPKRLVRTDDDAWIAGVCGGIARYFDLDPALVRILFIAAVVVFGSPLVVYPLLWIIMPRQTQTI